MYSKLREINETQEGGPSNSISDDIYSEVMRPERHGHIHGYGPGPTPTLVFGSTSIQYRTNLEEMHVELNIVHARMKEMQKKHEEDRRAYLEHMEKAIRVDASYMAKIML